MVRDVPTYIRPKRDVTRTSHAEWDKSTTTMQQVNWDWIPEMCHKYQNKDQSLLKMPYKSSLITQQKITFYFEHTFSLNEWYSTLIKFTI